MKVFDKNIPGFFSGNQTVQGPKDSFNWTVLTGSFNWSNVQFTNKKFF